MDRKTYTIGEKQWSLSPLNLHQDVALVKEIGPIITSLDWSAFLKTEMLDIGPLINSIVGDPEKLLRVAAIILVPEGQEFDPDNWQNNEKELGYMTNAQAFAKETGIVEDFFSLNESWLSRLMPTGNSATATPTKEIHPALQRQPKRQAS